MVEKLVEKVNETSVKEVDNSRKNFLRYLAGGLVAGILGLSAGYGVGKYHSLGMESKSKYHSLGIESKINGEKAPIKNSSEVVSNDKGVVYDEEDLEERAKKYSDIFVYVKDENSEKGELRMIVDKLSEKEKAEFISRKGVDYNKKEGYISFSSEFEDRESYNSMKDLAILNQFHEDNDISEEEKKFIKENSPWAYDLLFLFEESVTKKEENMKEEDYKPEDHPFIQGLVNFYFGARLKLYEKQMAEGIKGINIFNIFGGSGDRDYSKDIKKEDNKKRDNKKDVDEAPAAPIKER